MSTFYGILLVFLGYTALKSAWLWPGHPALAAFLAVPFFVLMLAWQFVFRNNQDVAETGWYQVLAWTGSLAMGTWASFILISIPVDLARSVGWVLNFLAPDALRWPSAALPTWTDIYRGVLALSVVIGIGGNFVAVGGPRVKRVPVTIPGLPKALRGLRIAQISDLHIGPTIRESYVADVVRRTNAEDVDLVVVTGDLADADADAIRVQTRPLADLTSRLGVYYVTGNHEYYWGTHGLIDLARSLGLQPLLNENRILDWNGARILVGGVTDPMGARLSPSHQPNVARAATHDRTVDLRLLLAHRPEVCLAAEPAGFDLQFSGHTHNGQFFPFNLLIPLFHRFYRGLNRHGRLWVYVNAGTGYWGPANRFGNRAEITSFTLA